MARREPRPPIRQEHRPPISLSSICMERSKSFTGRARRLTNRWSVKASDLLARALITVGGIGTIVTVLLVFVFLLYVAIPLFLSTTLSQGETAPRPESQEPLLV